MNCVYFQRVDIFRIKWLNSDIIRPPVRAVEIEFEATQFPVGNTLPPH